MLALGRDLKPCSSSFQPDFQFPRPLDQKPAQMPFDKRLGDATEHPDRADELKGVAHKRLVWIERLEVVRVFESRERPLDLFINETMWRLEVRDSRCQHKGNAKMSGAKRHPFVLADETSNSPGDGAFVGTRSEANVQADVARGVKARLDWRLYAGFEFDAGHGKLRTRSVRIF